MRGLCPRAPGIYRFTLVLVQFHWPVLKRPRMAGFQVAAEGQGTYFRYYWYKSVVQVT